MSIELITVLMFGVMLVLLAFGLPISFALGATGMVFAIFLWGPVALKLAVSSMYGVMFNFVFIAIPLFVFMANMLERSGIADDLYNMMYLWFGHFRGGLAIGTVVICTIFAAMSGISALGTVTMGMVALPSMFRRGYNKELTMGSIMAGGALGVLIPPSVPFIVYSFFSNRSVGELFMGGILPGLLLSSMFIIYIAVRCYLNPALGPALPAEEKVSWTERLVSTRSLILPIILVVAVLGSIFTGIASPTESAGVGAFGAVVCAAIYRKLNWPMAKEAAMKTLNTTGMVMWIAAGAIAFTAVYSGVGAVDFIRNTIGALQVSPWVIQIGMQLSLFILGCFLDPNGIMMITLPVYIPLCKALGFDLAWFGVLFVMNMEMGYLTPPFGFNLFYMKGVAPKEVSMNQIYRSVWPFVTIQGLGLIIVMIFPQIAMYLPKLMFRG